MSAIVTPGLVFAIPISDQLFGFGHVIAKQHPIFYMIAYDLQSETSAVVPAAIQSSKPIIMGNFFDVLIKKGRWKGLMHLTAPRVAFPCFKVKIGEKFYVESWDRERKREATASEIRTLQFRSNFGPIILENALKASFGFGPWEELFDPVKAENVARTSEVC